MIEKKIELSEQSFFNTYIIEFSKYVQNGNSNTWQPPKRPAIIIVPGGGYQYIADSEEEPVVYHFLSKGYSCFSLHYSLGDKSEYPIPLLELFKTISYIREHSEEWWLDSEAICVCGFSAGAHLAGLAATQYHLEEFQMKYGLNEKDIKPNAAVLSYPITNITKLYAETPNRVNLWGKMLKDVNPRVNIVDYVNSKMCPVFLWHTRTDGIVPVSQSLELIEKMHVNNVMFECHIFGEGYHGLSTNDVLSNYKGAIQNGVMVPNVAHWVDMCSAWMNNLFAFNV